MTSEDKFDRQTEPCGPDCACAASNDSDESETSGSSRNRRTAVSAAAGAGALSALAGCNFGSSGDEGNETTSANTESQTTAGGLSDSRNTESITFTLNGEKKTFDVDPQTELLYVLRDEAGEKGPKFGCGLSQCGACTVLLGDNAIRSCVTPVKSVAGKEITTTSGLGTKENLGSLQQAFIDQQAAQCGYCISGMILESEAFLRQNSNPSKDEIKQALDGHLCRCGTHNRIVDAVKQAAGDR